MTLETISFEQAFERLEQILDKMNNSKLALEDSMKMFEEAEGLIRACNTRLTFSGERVEALIKLRGQVVLDSVGRPKTENFAKTTQPSNFLIRDEASHIVS